MSEPHLDNDPVIEPDPFEPLEEWTLVRVGEVLERTTTQDPARNPEQSFFYIDVSSVSRESLSIVETVKFLGKDAPSRARKRVEVGDVIFATVRPRLKRVAIVPASLNDQICSTAFCVLRARRTILDPWFLYFATCREEFVCQVAEHERGSSYPAITDGNVKNGFVLLPPLTSQRSIVHILRTVQAAREASQRTIAAARQLKASLMRHLFTYGPVSVGQADQVTLRETDFGSVPQSWPTIPLEGCSEVQTGVAKGRSLNGAEVVSVPYLRVANVQDGYLDLAEIKNIEIKRSELSRFSLQAGDVVLTEGGDFDKLGRGFIWNGEVPVCVHQNHIFAVRANRSLILPEFLAYLTQSPYGKAYFLSVAHKTTNLACINTTKLKAFPALVPTIQDQQDIVDTLTAVDQKIAAEQKKRSALDALFKTLLDQLMTGKIRLTDLGLPVLLEAG